jgi:hypothetical protein
MNSQGYNQCGAKVSFPGDPVTEFLIFIYQVLFLGLSKFILR